MAQRKPIELVLTPDAKAFLPLARDVLAKLDAQRRRTGLPVLTKALFVSGVMILVKAQEIGDKIILWGSAGAPYILLSDGQRAIAYNYYTDIITDVPRTFQGELNPVFNGTCQYETGQSTLRDGQWLHAEVQKPGEYVGGIPHFEAGIYFDQTEILAQIGGDVFPVATAGSHTELAVCDYYSVLIPDVLSANTWNQMHTIALYQRFLSNHNGQAVWRWTPNFEFVPPMEGRVPGWYYVGLGEDDIPLGSLEGALGTFGEVELLGFLEVRNKDARDYQFGYCEAVTRLDTATPLDLPLLVFFIADAPRPDEGSTWFSYRVYNQLFNATMRGGTTPVGRNPSFFFRPPYGNPSGSLPETLHMWSHKAHGNAEAVCIVTTGQRDGVLCGDVFRWPGAVTGIYSVENYLTHSVSPDGTVVAIFSTTAEGLTAVAVLDLYGQKENPLFDVEALTSRDEKYLGPGYTLVRERVFDAPFLTACIIPRRAAGFVPSNLIDREVYDIAESNIDTPAFGSVHWPRDGVGAVEIFKMVVDGGVRGSVGRSEDPCFASTVIIDDPSNPPGDDKFVTSWGSGGSPNDLINGLVRGDFVGSHPRMQFAGAGRGDIRTVTLAEMGLSTIFDAGIGAWVLSPEHAVGEITFGGTCFDDEGVLLEDCYDREEVTGDPCFQRVTTRYASGTASTSCGQSAGPAEIEVYEAVENYVGINNSSWPAEASLIGSGFTFSVTGGNLPLTGTFNSDGIPATVTKTGDRSWQVTFACSPSTSGQPAGGSFVVSDDCMYVERGYRFNAPGAFYTSYAIIREDTFNCVLCYDPGLGDCTNPNQLFSGCLSNSFSGNCTLFEGTFRIGVTTTVYGCPNCPPSTFGTNPCGLDASGWDAYYSVFNINQWVCP